MILQRGQMLALPASGLAMGLLTALLYEAALGPALAWALGALLGAMLGLVAGWVAYRGDGAARHTVGNSLLYVLAAAPFAGGGSLLLAQMTGLQAWRAAAWVAGLVTVLAPVLGTAWLTRRRLTAEGETGSWARSHLDLRAGVLVPGALAAGAVPRPAVAPWLVGAMALNVPLAWRLMGGADTGLLVLGLACLVAGVVWGGAAQAGPALGAAWFVLDLERRTGRRLRHPQWAGVQDMRRSHWLARWFMRDA